jgi:spore germination protein GerM
MLHPYAEQVHDRSVDSPRRLVWVLGAAALVAAGIWVRTLPAGSLRPAGVFSWTSTTTVNLYFADGQFLFPVSRRFQINDQLPRAALEALLAGPSRSGRLRSTVPRDVEIRSFSIADGIARIDLSGGLGVGDDERIALAAITETMTHVPGVIAVAVSVKGQPLRANAPRTPLLYFPGANGLVAVPTNATNARAALAAYLSGPPAPEMTGVPADVRLLTYDYDTANRLLSIGFTYTLGVRALALEKPERTRMLLLGLIASLTEFPDVGAVRLDFGGQSRLGLGECSDLLRSPQPRPALLNDERLLD